MGQQSFHTHAKIKFKFYFQIMSVMSKHYPSLKISLLFLYPLHSCSFLKGYKKIISGIGVKASRLVGKKSQEKYLVLIPPHQ